MLIFAQNLMLLTPSIAEQIDEGIKWIYEKIFGAVQSPEDIYNTAKGLAGAGRTAIQALSGSAMASLAERVLRFNNVDAMLTGQLISIITGPVGFVMMAIYFLTAFLEQYKNGHEPTLEDFARPAFFLVVADLILSNIGTVVGALMSLSNLGADTLSAHVFEIFFLSGGFDPSYTIPEMGAAQTNLIALLPSLLINVISLFLSIIASAILYVILLTSKMELVLRFAFSPIGLSAFADETKKAEAFRYLKKLIASAFYLLAIIAVLYYTQMLGTSLLSQSAGEGSNFLINTFVGLEATVFQIALPFAGLGMVSMAKNIVNESFGV